MRADRRAASLTRRRPGAATGDDHLPHLVLVEPGLEQPVGPDRQAVLDRRIVRVAAVAREERPLDPDRAHAFEHVLPRRLAAVRRRQAALEQRSRDRRARPDPRSRSSGRELGVGDDDVLHALLERAVDHGERVVPAEVPGGQDQVVARDRAQARRASRAGGSRRRPSPRPARRSSPSSRSSCWRLAQSGTLSPGFGSVRPAVSAGESTVGIQTIRAPSRAAISTATAFIPPTALFSVIVPIARTPGTARNDLRALRRRRVVGLEAEAREADVGEPLCQRDVVDPALRDVRCDVNV